MAEQEEQLSILIAEIDAVLEQGRRLVARATQSLRCMLADQAQLMSNV